MSSDELPTVLQVPPTTEEALADLRKSIDEFIATLRLHSAKIAALETMVEQQKVVIRALETTVEPIRREREEQLAKERVKLEQERLETMKSRMEQARIHAGMDQKGRVAGAAYLKTIPTHGKVYLPGIPPIPKGVQSILMSKGGVLPAPVYIYSGQKLADPTFYTFISDTMYHITESVQSLVTFVDVSCISLTICCHDEGVDYLSNIATLPNLLCLNLINVSNVTDISWIRGCSKLTHLVLYGCKNLVDVAPLRSLASLKFVDLRGTGVTCSASVPICLELETVKQVLV